MELVIELILKGFTFVRKTCACAGLITLYHVYDFSRKLNVDVETWRESLEIGKALITTLACVPPYPPADRTPSYRLKSNIIYIFPSQKQR